MMTSTRVAAATSLVLAGVLCMTRTAQRRRRRTDRAGRQCQCRFRHQWSPGDRRDGHAPRGGPEQGADQRHRADPGDMDIRGIKDFQDIARFTPGVSIDNSGTNAISIRGISSSGGAGTTGIYIDDTPIQMRCARLQPGRHAAEDLRPGSRRGAARTAGHAVRRRLRRRHGALHPDAAEHDRRQHLRAQRGLRTLSTASRATSSASPMACR